MVKLFIQRAKADLAFAKFVSDEQKDVYKRQLGNSVIVNTNTVINRFPDPFQHGFDMEKPGKAIQGRSAALFESRKSFLAAFDNVIFQLRQLLAHIGDIILQRFTALLKHCFQRAVLHLSLIHI